MLINSTDHLTVLELVAFGATYIGFLYVGYLAVKGLKHIYHAKTNTNQA